MTSTTTYSRRAALAWLLLHSLQPTFAFQPELLGQALDAAASTFSSVSRMAPDEVLFAAVNLFSQSSSSIHELSSGGTGASWPAVSRLRHVLSSVAQALSSVSANAEAVDVAAKTPIDVATPNNRRYLLYENICRR